MPSSGVPPASQKKGAAVTKAKKAGRLDAPGNSQQTLEQLIAPQKKKAVPKNFVDDDPEYEAAVRQSLLVDDESDLEKAIRNSLADVRPAREHQEDPALQEAIRQGILDPESSSTFLPSRNSEFGPDGRNKQGEYYIGDDIMTSVFPPNMRKRGLPTGDDLFAATGLQTTKASDNRPLLYIDSEDDEDEGSDTFSDIINKRGGKMTSSDVKKVLEAPHLSASGRPLRKVNDNKKADYKEVFALDREESENPVTRRALDPRRKPFSLERGGVPFISSNPRRKVNALYQEESENDDADSDVEVRPLTVYRKRRVSSLSKPQRNAKRAKKVEIRDVSQDSEEEGSEREVVGVEDLDNIQAADLSEAIDYDSFDEDTEFVEQPDDIPDIFTIDETKMEPTDRDQAVTEFLRCVQDPTMMRMVQTFLQDNNIFNKSPKSAKAASDSRKQRNPDHLWDSQDSQAPSFDDV